MEEDNGLELSLGLSCGGSNGKLKGKEGATSDVKTEEGGNVNNPIDDLKNFLNTSTTAKQDAEDGSEKSDAAQSKDNFFTNLSKPGVVGEASTNVHVTGATHTQFSRYGEVWAGNSKSPEVEEVKLDLKGDGSSNMWLEAGNKRKMLFEDMNRQKKQERENQHIDAHGNKSPMVSSSLRASHVSVTTEDGSTVENEDVAESQLDGSTSGLALNLEEGSKHYNGDGRGSAEASKDRYGQKQSNAAPVNDPRFLNVSYGTSLPPMTMQYTLPSKITGNNGESSTSGAPSPCVMQLMPYGNNEGHGSQTINPGTMPLTFGYSPLQLPTLNSERSWGLNSNSMQVHSPYVGRNISSGIPNSDRSENGSDVARGMVQAPNSSSEPLPGERKAFELTKCGGRQHATEENAASSSTPAEDEMKGNKTKEAHHNRPVEGILDGSAIRPGVSPGLKFGGSGSYPDLPWVSTTAPGPNGRTISGVTYRYDKNQIKIVCACHGFHMTPEEFVQHASADQQNPESNTSLASFPNGNPAASAQS